MTLETGLGKILDTKGRLGPELETSVTRLKWRLGTDSGRGRTRVGSLGSGLNSNGPHLDPAPVTLCVTVTVFVSDREELPSVLPPVTKVPQSPTDHSVRPVSDSFQRSQSQRVRKNGGMRPKSGMDQFESFLTCLDPYVLSIDLPV